MSTTPPSTPPADAVPPATPGDFAVPRRVLLWVTLYACAIFLPFLGSSRTVTRHEVIVTLPALQMIENGDWLIPYYTNRVWIDKPPLIGWVTALLYVATGGFSEWACRLPAALSAIGLCVLVAILARRFMDERVALLAGLAQATAVYAYMQGRLGEIDMPFALLLGGAHATLLWHWGRGELRIPWLSAAAFHILAALAFLAKGPLALAFLGCTILAYCGVRRSFKPLTTVLLTPTIVLFPLVGLSWYVAVYLKVPELALERWAYTYVDRFTGQHHLGRQSPLLYAVAIPWLALPWSVVLLLGARPLFRDARRPDAYFQKYLWCWFLAGLVPLLISQFKHKHYCIPILPPLSIFAGQVLVLFAERIGAIHAKRIFIGAFLGIAVALAIIGGFVMPRRDHRKPTVDFVRTQTAKLPPGETLYVVGLAQSAVYPYIQCRWVGLNSAKDVQRVLEAADQRPVRVLTLQGFLPLAARLGLGLEVEAVEPVRRKYPAPLVLVMGTARRIEPTSGPALTREEELESELIPGADDN
jgi:4-amino-4-deoxy-L-arabinose transferase-like glycosyltransferase